MSMVAPFPYIGGKSKVASMVWPRFGHVRTYAEPFAGSLGMLLGRPDFLWSGRPVREIANDLSGHVVNVWRAIREDSEGLASLLEQDCPVFELDLRARQNYLVSVESDLTETLLSDPKAYDLEAAAYWISGISAHIIGSSFPTADDMRRPNVSSYGKGVHALGRREVLNEIFAALSDRLRYVKVFCEGWSRCVTEQVLETRIGPAAVFLDPPYTAESGRTSDLYDRDDLSVGHEVYQWCLENGEDENLRIALCGLEGEYDMPSNWKEESWEVPGNFNTASRERIWFSPSCIDPVQDLGVLTSFMSS